MPILTIQHIFKTYKLRRERVPVLRDLSMTVGEGEWVAILGSSGSGKSTLLHLIGGLDRPDRGKGTERPSIVYRDRELVGAPQSVLGKLRSRDVGFVFQFFHLVPELTVLQNVLLAPMIRHGRFGYGARRADATAEAERLLEAVGLTHRLRHRPKELSGGERQRAAIARALVNRPTLLLADELTGNLDRKTGQKILDALTTLRSTMRAERPLSMVLVTHDPAVAQRADRVLHLKSGVLVEESSAGDL